MTIHFLPDPKRIWENSGIADAYRVRLVLSLSQ